MQSTEGWQLVSAPFFIGSASLYKPPFPSARHVERRWAQFATAIRRRKGIHTLVWKKHLEILLRCWVIWKARNPPSSPASHFGGRIWHLGDSIWRVRVARTSRQPSVDCTPFYRQQLCRGQCIQERSRPQQHTWNSKPFVIFFRWITAAQSLQLQHLMWTEVMNSRHL